MKNKGSRLAQVKMELDFMVLEDIKWTSNGQQMDIKWPSKGKCKWINCTPLEMKINMQWIRKPIVTVDAQTKSYKTKQLKKGSRLVKWMRGYEGKNDYEKKQNGSKITRLRCRGAMN